MPFKRSPKPPVQADFNRMVQSRREEIRRITEQLSRGDISVFEWTQRFDAVLLEGHTQGYFLGRMHGGDLSGLSEEDRQMGEAARQAEASYLADFRAALGDHSDARYWSADLELRQDAVNARADLYAGKFRASAGQGFVDASADAIPDEEFVWELGDEQHCEDCPSIADLSPFTAETLFAVPGDGSTACLGNCGCTLVRASDGKRSFEIAPSYGAMAA